MVISMKERTGLPCYRYRDFRTDDYIYYNYKWIITRAIVDFKLKMSKIFMEREKK